MGGTVSCHCTALFLLGDVLVLLKTAGFAVLYVILAVLYVFFAVVYVILAVLYVLPFGSRWETRGSEDFSALIF